MVRAAGLGFLAAAVDCRYHGERAAPGAVTPYKGYQDALVRYTPVPPEALLHLAGLQLLKDGQCMRLPVLSALVAHHGRHAPVLARLDP